MLFGLCVREREGEMNKCNRSLSEDVMQRVKHEA